MSTVGVNTVTRSSSNELAPLSIEGLTAPRPVAYTVRTSPGCAGSDPGKVPAGAANFPKLGPAAPKYAMAYPLAVNTPGATGLITTGCGGDGTPFSVTTTFT